MSELADNVALAFRQAVRYREALERILEMTLDEKARAEQNLIHEIAREALDEKV